MIEELLTTSNYLLQLTVFIGVSGVIVIIIKFGKIITATDIYSLHCQH